MAVHTFLAILAALVAFILYIVKLYTPEKDNHQKLIIIDNHHHHHQKLPLPEPPGPKPIPILGNLHLLGKYEVPFQGFTDLAKKYGDVYKLKLGATPCLVVNSVEKIREVLNQNGKFFGGRPDFIRFNKLFGGDRNNCE